MKQSIILLVSITLCQIENYAQHVTQTLDSLVMATMRAFDVPGMAVGIVKDDSVIYHKGFGLQSLSRKDSVDEATLFGIASNSKGFTCIALGMLVDEGKIKWSDPVRKHIPEFQTANPYVTEHFTIEDLVTHRGGMGLGAGDLMFFPEGTDFTIDDVIYNMRYMQLEAPFRKSFNYNNNLYNIAGEVLKRVSGMSWEDFIESRILEPVGMNYSKASYNRAKHIGNKIDAHAPVDGKAVQIPHDWHDLANPAGGIMSNVIDMNIWGQFLINNGKTSSGKQLISKEQLNYIFQLHNPTEVRSPGYYNTHFSGYGLGYFISDVKGGYKQITHTGGLLGTVTQFTVIPELKLSITVLTNQQQGAAFTTITNTIKDYYLGYTGRDWLKMNKERYDTYQREIEKGKQEVFQEITDIASRKSCTIAADKVVGRYKDNWWGDVIITEERGILRLKSVRSPKMAGTMKPYKQGNFVIVWDDRSYDADAFALIAYDEHGMAKGIKMKAISGITDFSFDFEHLDFKRAD